MSDLLREALAAAAHDSWSRWMNHLFNNGRLDDDGTVTIPAELVKRWKRQVVTPYSQLTSLEQDSDRAEADRILAIVAGKNSEEQES